MVAPALWIYLIIVMCKHITINILIGLLTPPLGMAVYISADLAEVSVMEGFKKIRATSDSSPHYPFTGDLCAGICLVHIPNLIFK